MSIQWICFAHHCWIHRSWTEHHLFNVTGRWQTYAQSTRWSVDRYASCEQLCKTVTWFNL